MEISNQKLNNLISQLLSVPLKQLSLESAFKVSSDKAGEISSLHMPLFVWEKWEPQDYATFESYQNDKKKFQNEFTSIQKNVIKILGNPLGKGKKANFDKETLQINGWLLVYYNYAFWQVDGKLIILQQCERAIDGAVEISLLVLPHQKTSSLPSFPLKV